MRRVSALAALVLLASCATHSPFDDLAGAQQRLDQNNIAFAVSHADAPHAFVLRARPSSAANANTDVNVAAITAAPQNCTVTRMLRQPDGGYRVDYSC